MIKKLKRLFCKHDFVTVAKHQSTQQNLWKCSKCNIFYIQHYGIDIGYKTGKPNLNGWIEL